MRAGRWQPSAARPAPSYSERVFAPPSASPPASSPGLREPILAFLAVTALASALFWTGQVVPVVAANLHAAIALLFLGAPRVAARLSGRPFDYTDAGLRLDPIGKNARVLGIALAITWPLFCVGFFLWYEGMCGALKSPALGPLVDWMIPQCPHWRGLGGGRLRWPPELVMTALTQLLVVAVPEELFFRGYLQGRFDQRWTPRWRIFGTLVGPGWLWAAVFFAFGHVLVDFNPERFAVFVPGLVFGWMRARTGSIAAAAAFHALCNLLSEVMHTSFFY